MLLMEKSCHNSWCCRFADVLQTLGRSVAFLGKRSEIALDLSSQLWHNSDKEVRHEKAGLRRLPPDFYLIRPLRSARLRYSLTLTVNDVFLLFVGPDIWFNVID